MSGNDANLVFGYQRSDQPASFLCQFLNNAKDGYAYDVWTASEKGYDPRNYLAPGTDWHTTAFDDVNPLALAPADPREVSRLYDVFDVDDDDE